MSYTPQTALQEQWHAGGFLVSQANGHRSFDRGWIAGGGKVYPGTVLGKQTVGAASAAAAPGNAGNGTVGAITLSQGAMPGNYIISFESPTAFTVSGPSTGQEVGHGIVGTVFTGGGVSFTIAAGGTAFVINDEIILTVAAGAGNYVPCTSTAADGSQNAAAIAYGFSDATNGPVHAALTVRACEVNTSELVWDASMSATNQATALAQLAAFGIISR